VESEALIGHLASGLRPVRVLPSPVRQAMGWLVIALAVVAAAVALEGLRADLVARMRQPAEVLQCLASIVTAALAALAATMLARPDRDARWGLVPVAALLVWLASLGWGTALDFARLGAVVSGETEHWGCVGFVAGVGTPLTLGLLVMLRHAGPVRPLPVLLLGGLASGALTSAGCTLAHHLDAALMVLVWHGGAVLALVLLGWQAGRWVLARPLGAGP